MRHTIKLAQPFLKFVLFLAILTICWFLGRVFKVDIRSYQEILSRYPLALSGLVFVVLYVGTTTFIWFGPKDILRVSSAVLFGAGVSTVFVWTAEMINAVIMFHLSRALGREYVRQRLRVKEKDLDKIKEDTSLLGVAAWRVNPLAPFRFIDLGYGLTSILFSKYFAGSVVVTFFRIFWLQFILAGVGTSLLDNTGAVVDYLMKDPDAARYSMFYFLAVIVLTAAAMAARFLRRRKNGIREM
jgi:uncharacterized membrane protein YdjX (TVP38/TMEM64 family)